MAATTSPRVSVIVPCYNLGRYLDEALESLHRQTFTDFDLLIVDDGSDDEQTCARLQVLSGLGLRVLRTPNRGLSAARNVGIRHTTAEFLCCVDADDVVAPTLLERSVEWLDRQPEIGFVSHWLDAFGDEQWDWRPTSCEFPQLLEANTVNGAAVMRRRLFEAVGGFDESLRNGCEDWDFWISAIEHGEQGAIIPEVLYRYRRRPDSMSRLMTGSDVFAGLYRRLAEKHAASFLAHLPAVVAERERELVHFTNHVEALEAQQSNWLSLRLQHARDTRDMLRRKLVPADGTPGERVAAMTEELIANRATVEALERELHAARTVSAEHERRLRDQSDEIERLSAESRQLAVHAAMLNEMQARLAEEQAAERRQFEARLAEAVAAARRIAEEQAAVAEAQLRTELHRTEGEIGDLRASWSWKITGPLRALYALVARPERRS